MNKALVAAVTLLLASPASASVPSPRIYLLDFQLSLDGKVVSSPRVVAQEGTKTELSDVNKKTKTGTFIEVTPHRVDSERDNQTFLQMVVGKIVDGKKEIISTPQLMAMENEEAAMEIGEGDRQIFKISAKVTRDVGKAMKVKAEKK